MLNKISMMIALTLAVTTGFSMSTVALSASTLTQEVVQTPPKAKSKITHKKQKTSHLVSRVLKPGYFKHLYERGIASFYGTEWQGSRTASGIPFNTYSLTAAHKYLPFGTHVLVKNLQNGKEVIVRIMDRGPFVVGRVIDLSLAAKRALGMGGTQMVALYVIP